jgi:serine/threonine-protein kinase
METPRLPSPRSRRYRIDWIRSDGGGNRRRCWKARTIWRTFSFTPDGRRLAYFEVSPDSGNDIWILPIDTTDPEQSQSREAGAVLTHTIQRESATVSPDGHWIAYTSFESGRSKCTCVRLPGPGGKWQVSSDSGEDAMWSRNGRELFFETLTPVQPDHGGGLFSQWRFLRGSRQAPSLVEHPA